MTQEGLENLKIGIIGQAAQDYMSCLRCGKLRRKEMEELKEFFYSDWFEMLTDVDPDYLINKMEEEVRNEKRRKRA